MADGAAALPAGRRLFARWAWGFTRHHGMKRYLELQVNYYDVYAEGLVRQSSSPALAVAASQVTV